MSDNKNIEKIEIILLHETVKESIINDFTSFFLAVALIGIGVYLQSDAMQWIGFILTAISIMANGLRMKRVMQRKTPQEAADYLLYKYNVIASREVIS